jgi:hypothetical protein
VVETTVWLVGPAAELSKVMATAAPPPAWRLLIYARTMEGLSE